MTLHGHNYILPHMKPDKNHCLNCDKEISNRAKYCSEACRKAYGRNPDKLGQKPTIKSDKPNPDTQSRTEPGQDDFRASLTKTDRTFYDRALKDFGKPYYKFSDKIREETCMMGSCGKNFKTGLSMLKFCSYEHYTQALGGRK